MKKIILFLLFILTCQYTTGQSVSSHSVATISANITEVRFSMNTNGNASRAILYYAVSPAVATTGTSMNYSAPGGGSILPGTLTMQDTNIFTLGGLPLGSTYNYTINITPVTTTNVIHTVSGSFTTRTASVVTNVTANPIANTTATINYSINANGAATTPVVSYGTTPTTLGTSVNGTVVTGTTPTTGSIEITGLLAGTTYHYRVSGNSVAGTGQSPIQTFTTTGGIQIPLVSAVSSSNLGSTTATINYSINANGASTTPVIKYGTTNTVAGLTLSQSCSAVTGTTAITQTQGLTGLLANTTYYYRVEASNTSGAATPSSILSFTTTPAVTAAIPVISAVSTGALTPTSATINYSINANGSLTNPRIVYSSTFPTQNFSENLPVVTGSTTTVQTYQLTNLQSNKTYTYSIEASSAAGNAIASTPIQFTTAPPASVVPNSLPTQEFCNSATVAQLDAIGTAIKWYAAATGGSPLATTAALASGTYYVTQTQANRSESARLAITVTVNVVNAPTGNASQTFVQGATVRDLVANGVGSVVWYASSANATANVNALATTTILTNNSIYFAVLQTVAGCRSTTPLAVTVSLTPATTAPAITALTTASVVPSFESARVNFNLNAFGTGTAYDVEYTRDVIGAWTTVVGGATAVNSSTAFSVSIPGLRSREQYFVRVRATNTSNQVTVSNEVSFTTLNPIAVTNLGSSNITSTTAQINYTLNTNGINAFVEIRYQASAVFNNNNPFTTAVVSNFTLNTTTATNLNYVLTGLTPNTLYSYEFGAITNNNGNFEGGQNAAFTTSNPQSPLPTAATPQTFCDGATVASLMATGNNIKWYANASGGSQLATTTLLTPTTYYVTQTQPNLTESARLAVGVNITVVNAPTAQAQSFCNSATVANLTATGTGTIAWFNVATGGTALANNTALATGTYFVQQTIGSCTSTRLAVSVTVNVVNAPTGSATQIVAAGATIANLNATGSNVVWFASAANATANTNPLPATTPLVNSTTYFAMQTVGSCRSSASLAVTATVSLSVSDFNLGLQFNIYPNPAINVVNIELASELKSVEVYSLQGQKIISSSSKELNVSDLSSGVYMIRVEDTNGAIATKRLLKK